MAHETSAKQAPALNIPKSDNCCRLSIIDTTCEITVPTEFLVQPPIEGWKYINLPDFAFHIKNDRSGKEILFDLGTRKDWENHVPHLKDMIYKIVRGWRVTKEVIDILPEGGVDVNNIDAVVLSHYHFDHVGHPAALPKSVKLVVGPTFRENFFPGWPANEKSTFHEADFEGRDVIELSFSDSKIGQFHSYDYFGDGSFYILNVPGHAPGHVNGLVRTTPDTFVLLGGDTCHFTGVIRPSQYAPMPDELPADTVLDHGIPRPCSCATYLSAHMNPKEFKTSPFLTVSDGPITFYDNPVVSREAIQGLIEFDADPNILIAIAHDPTALDVFDFFPKGTMNEWKAKNWKQASHWGFFSELPLNGKVLRPPLVDGCYQDGKKIRDL